ncbi:partitioning defective 3 homolog isoform X2 [Ceratitis capitata]|uniref:partitioning defective 3 homolog isoform X2 n=1 Tax=Ceratitis capitata TaxID=7213 RepID=UPI000329E190|nr:partitioning defective 3 homolog isoform X2 [Ceratitis capitata]
MFDVPPKCPALANKLTGIFGWRHTYKVAAKHEGIQHTFLQKSYSLTLPKRPPSPYHGQKEPDSWVAVHHLQTQSGILDPDDCVGDVADDREQILASFDDSGPDPGVPQGGGDGASGSSSVGTGSPDIFRDPTNTDAPTNGQRGGDATTPHIEVTSTTAGPMTGLGLQVRRSSDPNLLASLKAEGGNKRWSAAAPHCGGDSPERVLLDKSGYLTPQWEEEDDGQQHTNAAPAQQPFARSGRLSMQFLGDGTGYKWMEAAEKLQNQQHQQHAQQQHSPNQYAPPGQMYTTKSLPRESKRKEPLGQAYESIREKDGEMLLIINEYGSPLGLTAMPDNEHGGGLLVQNVEPGSRAERGRLRRGDRILEINGTKLIGLTESKVQDYLRHSLEASELRVRVLRASGSANQRSASKSRRRDSKVAEMIEAEEKLASSVETKVATVSPTRKPHTAPVGTSLQVANTRKLGRKIEIVLKKGPNGLGFSVTTRDNPAGGHCPIYIKNILPRGAAIEDGRLKPGDRLLEVDGVPMTGKTQTDVVSILRATQPGATVRLVVSRQQELAAQDEREINYEEKERVLMNTPPKPPAPVLPSSLQKQQQQLDKLPNGVKKSNSARSLFEQHQQHQQYQLNESQHFIDAGSESAASSDSLQAGIAWRSREVLTLHIPVHDTEKAGLGVSVKGKTTSNSSGGSGSMKHDGDLGIFVKNVIHGGAASRDGRLRMNDQLLSVNGVSLLGQNNAEAMETLRRAMVNNPGKHPGMITLSVARKIARSASSGDILEQTANSSSNASDNSGATVIYLSPEKNEARSAGGSGGGGNATNEMNRWSNPVLDRLTGGVCSSNSSQHVRRPSRDHLSAGGVVVGGIGGPPGSAGVHGLRNESYYMATNDTWSPALHQQKLLNGHINSNNTVLIEDDPEPMSPTLPHHPNDSVCTQSSSVGPNSSTAPPGFDATYSSQLSLETNNSGVEHFSRDALGRRSISEKHHAALDARETGTYQRNKKLREERERERRIQLTKSAIYGGSMESLTARIANANAQIPGYKHTKTASGVEAQQLQAEARDQVGDLGPSLGLKKSSSLESLQTMVQEIQMSDEPRGPTALRAPRGRGREDSLRAAVVADPEAGKPRKHWLLEEGTDQDGGFAHRNGPFQSSLNDGKHKSRAKKPSILRGIGHMFRFGKNRKDGVVPVETATANAVVSVAERPPATLPNNQLPAAALAALDRNTKLLPPAYQPPPPLPPANSAGPGGNTSAAGNLSATNSNGGIHHNDIFNHRYQHYANYDELHQQQISESENNSTKQNQNQNSTDVLSESTLECMRQQVIRQRIKVEAESYTPRYVRLKSEDWICFELNRRHQHYHSQRSARSQDINFQQHHHHAAMSMNNHVGNGGIDKSGMLRPTSTYYEYETVQHNVSPAAAAAQHHQLRNGSLKQNGHHSPVTVNGVQQQQQQQQHNNSNHHHQQQQQQQQAQQQTLGPQATQPHWKVAAMNGFSPASLNSSARSRGPFVTHVTIRDQSSAAIAAQPTYQTVQKQQPQFASAVVGANGTQPHASKV